MGRFTGLAFAGVLLATPLIVLFFGLVGSSGNSWVTAGYITGSICMLAILSFRGFPSPTPADAAFLAFCVCVLVSFAVNPIAAGTKELAALVLTLFAYPAARSIGKADLPSIRSAVMIISGTIVVIGTPFAVHALITQWDDMHGQPIVFGLTAANPLFTEALALLVLTAATSDLTRKSTALWCTALFLPTAIYAASMVRFIFIAEVSAILFAAILADTRQRRAFVLVIALAVVGAISCGVAARYKKAIILAEYAIESTLTKTTAAPINESTSASGSTSSPASGTSLSCASDVNMFNSVDMRKALLKDAVSMLPEARMFGLGLGSFVARSCMKMPVHNIVLQAMVEFGWIGGSLFVILLAAAFLQLLPVARADRNAAFLFCCLSFVVAISLAHGDLSQSVGLLALLGAAAGTYGFTVKLRHVMKPE